MSGEREMVVYTRSSFCPYQAKANRVFTKYNLEPRRILIDRDKAMEERVVEWTGFKSVPTIIIANVGEDVPYEVPSPLNRGQSPKGVDRGSMITEALEDQLEAWLVKHGIIDKK